MTMSRLFKRTLLIMLLLFGVIANVTSLFSGWQLYTRLSQEYRARAVAIAQGIAAGSVEVFLGQEAASIQAALDQFRDTPGVAYLLVTNGQGQIVAHTCVPQPPGSVRALLEQVAARRQPVQGDEPATLVSTLDDYLDVSAPILAGQAGFVHVGMSRQDIRDSILDVFLDIQLLTLVIFLGAAVAAYVLVGKISRPLAKLSQYAQRLARREFDATVEIDSRDEVGMLAATMTAMSHELSEHVSSLQLAVEQATRESADALAYLSAVIENLADGLLLMDQQGKVTQANPACASLFAQDPAQLLGRTCRDLLGLEPRDLLSSAAGQARRLLGLARADGSALWLEAAASLVKMGGRPSVICILRDVTARRLVEDKLEQARGQLEQRVRERTAALARANQDLQEEVAERAQAEEALRQSQERFRSLCESAPDIIFTLDPEARITYVNPAWQRLLGYPAPEALGRSLLDFVQPGEVSPFAEQLAAIVKEGRTLTNLSRLLIHQDGTVRAFNASAAPYLASQGLPLGIVGTLKDVTEHRLLEAQLLHAQKMEAVGTLAGGVAHEFNNILMTIKGYTQLAAMRGLDEKTSAEYLRKVDKSCQRAAALTSKMLTFSRLDVGEKAPARLNHILASVSQFLHQALPPSIQLQTKPTLELDWVQANSSQLEQVILNLALNARDAMAGSGVITLASLRRDLDQAQAAQLGLPTGAYVEAMVQDTGQGMTQEVLNHIFEPFFTTKEPGKGTGLGLSVAYSIVESHGGKIVAESCPGDGATFRVLLPAQDPPAEPQAQTRKPAKPPSGQGQRVLAVDDEPELRDIVRQVLEAHNYQVRTAGHGLQALEKYQQALERGEPFHLVILDLAMPVMDGKECLDRLLALDPRARVILATGHAGEASADQAWQQKAKAILLKPFDLRSLLTTVRGALLD